ncbi:unnamed protein product [Caretta caretta]
MDPWHWLGHCCSQERLVADATGSLGWELRQLDATASGSLRLVNVERVGDNQVPSNRIASCGYSVRLDAPYHLISEASGGEGTARIPEADRGVWAAEGGHHWTPEAQRDP